MTEFVAHPYQKIAIEFLADVPRAQLWAGMGMGKTVSTLTNLAALKMAGSGPALVLAPLRVAKTTWPDEVAKWDHLRHLKVVPVIGPKPAIREAALRQQGDIYTMNYENLPWLFNWLEANGCAFPFETVVCDESTRLKSMRPSIQKHWKTGTEFTRAAGGKRARQLARVAHKGVTRWINLTGTPAPAGLKDLWGQQWFIDAGQRLGITYEAFQQRWFRPKYNTDPKNQQAKYIAGSEPLPYAAQEINDRLRDCCLSLRAEDWFDVKRPLPHTVWIDLPSTARAQYNQMEKELFAEIAGVGVEAFNAAARTGKCLQMASGIAHYTLEDETKGWVPVHDERLEALESIVEETGGEPLLIQYHWRPDLERILKRFPKFRRLDNDPQTIKDWNAGKIPGLLAHAGSAGHGLNLQYGGYILVRYSYSWAREEFDQILERIGPVRQLQAGFNRVVRDIRIVARDTLDEAVLARHDTNRATEDLLMEYMARRS